MKNAAKTEDSTSQDRTCEVSTSFLDFQGITSKNDTKLRAPCRPRVASTSCENTLAERAGRAPPPRTC